MTKRKGKPGSRAGGNGAKGNGAGGNGAGGTSHSGGMKPGTEMTLEAAQRLIDEDHPTRAIELVESRLRVDPDSADLTFVLGHAHLQNDDLWAALAAFERARALCEEPEVLLTLASFYSALDLGVHALRAFRQARELQLPAQTAGQVNETVMAMEDKLTARAGSMDASADQVEEGLYQFERGRRALALGDFSASVDANRKSIRWLGDWPPPHNNLAQGLFYTGRPEEGLKVVRRVLDVDPDNIQALSNGVRFLSLMGRGEEARALWPALQGAVPGNVDDRMQKAEAAALLREHETVYQTLQRAVDGPDEDVFQRPDAHARLLLAIAAANLGRRGEAKRRLRSIQGTWTLARETLEALRAGHAGTGWSDHFRYFDALELLPADPRSELIDLLANSGGMAQDVFSRRLREFAKRYPQVVRMAEKAIWEDQNPREGIDLLVAVGTPQAHDVLWRFALSQAGDDHWRVDALTALAEAGEIAEGETVRAWLKGAWREIELKVEQAPDSGSRQSGYSSDVADGLNRATAALERGDAAEAEGLFEHVLELEPGAKEAYNNLGTIYARRGDDERAKEMFRKAREIDPHYVLAATNLATYYLSEEKVQEAVDLLAPLVDVTGIAPRDRAFYDLTQARLLLQQGQLEAATELLRTIVQRTPDYEPGREILESIEHLELEHGFLEEMSSETVAYWEGRRERELARRRQLQEQLNTLAPSLSDALPLYTKDALKGMARQVVLAGGWSTLRKAELVDKIIASLTDQDALLWVLTHLMADEERHALRTVMRNGGAMEGDAFDARYDNDLLESRHWNDIPPTTVMGWLRFHGLLVEATVDDALFVVVPVDVRSALTAFLM